MTAVNVPARHAPASAPLPRTLRARVTLVAAVMFAVALFPCGSASADLTVASGLSQAPKVSAAPGAFAWSVFDPSAGGWRLVVRRDASTEVLPIQPRPTPFDVDLGDDGHGALVASYSRCSSPTSGAELPHGCRLYYYDFATARERSIAVANARGYSQFDPSMATGRVAFVRIADGRRVGAGNGARIYLRNLTAGPLRRLPGGFENDDPRTGPTALDLSRTALAFAWDTQGASAFEPYSLATSQVSVDSLSGGQVLVALGTSGEISTAETLTPTLSNGSVYYIETGLGEGESNHSFRTLTLPGAQPGVAQAPASIHSSAISSTGTIYSACTANSGFPAGPPCQVVLVEHVKYTNPDQEVAHLARAATISMSPQMTIEQSPGHIPGNWLAWSAYDPARRNYRLILRGPNRPAAPAPVPPRKVPFDVQLGPRPGGGLLAVYSRCRAEPRLDPHDMLPLPTTGHGCRLYRYNIGAPHELVIPGSGSRLLPSAWYGRLAFVRIAADGRPAVYVGSLDGRGAPRRLPVGPSAGSSGLGPRAIMLHEGRLAYVWERRTRSGLRSEVRLDGSGPNSQLLDSATSRTGTSRELSPVFTAGVLSWARREGSVRSRFEVFGLSSHQLNAYLAPAAIDAFATNHLVVLNHLATGEVVYAYQEDHATVRIRRLATYQRELPLQTSE